MAAVEALTAGKVKGSVMVAALAAVPDSAAVTNAAAPKMPERTTACMFDMASSIAREPRRSGADTPVFAKIADF